MEPLEEGDPRQVGQFQVLGRLGAGGMGRVYLARTAAGDRFALKMIHQFLSDDVQFRRRFQREVMAARRVTGPNTAALVDADPDARPPWMAVEYVDGPTLTELIDQGGPLTPSSSVRLASGMAQALISIHSAGLVHRDLKPSNVLMGADGARLIDFGIAQASGASSLTMTGLVTGSAGFMSPEQAQAEHVTEASDVFALGTVLFFAATGHRPFGEGSMISVTYRVVHSEVDLSGIRDEGLRELIADCLMKDPDLRPTPREIAERCPGILDGSWRSYPRPDRDRSGDTVVAAALAPVRPTDAHTTLLAGAPPAELPPPPPTRPRSGPRGYAPEPLTLSPGRRGEHGRAGGTGLLAGLRRVPQRTLMAAAGGLLVLVAGTGVVWTLLNSGGSPGTTRVTETQEPGEDEPLPVTGTDGELLPVSSPTPRTSRTRGSDGLLTPKPTSSVKPSPGIGTTKATPTGGPSVSATTTGKPVPGPTTTEPEDPDPPVETTVPEPPASSSPPPPSATGTDEPEP